MCFIDGRVGTSTFITKNGTLRITSSNLKDTWVMTNPSDLLIPPMHRIILFPADLIVNSKLKVWQYA